MLVGYMRVSSDSDRQTTAPQRDALIVAGVDTRHLFEDKASGARDDRPGLKTCLDYLKAGDTLVVWKLDRLGRSLPHLLATIGRRRWDHMRLGFAVQLGTVRFLGTFLADPTEVPAAVAVTLAQQIGIADAGCLVRYREGTRTVAPRR